jgi:hypothetical protein
LLSLPAGRQGLILSGAIYPVLKAGASAVSSAERFGAAEVSSFGITWRSR